MPTNKTAVSYHVTIFGLKAYIYIYLYICAEAFDEPDNTYEAHFFF